MKSLLQLLLIGIISMLFITSCTMEKRVYMAGYNIEWNKRKNINKQDSSTNDHWKQKEQKHIREAEKQQNVIRYAETDNSYNDYNILTCPL